MKYRVVSRIFGILDVIIFLVVLALAVVNMTFHVFTFTTDFDTSGYSTSNEMMIVMFVLYSILFIFCLMSLVGSIKLILATGKGKNAKLAIRLCNLWLVVSWISFVLAFTSALIFLYMYVFIFGSQNRSHLVEYLLVCVFFILRGLGLYYVHNFNWELKDSVHPPPTRTEAMIPLAPMSTQRLRAPENNQLTTYAVDMNPPINGDETHLITVH